MLNYLRSQNVVQLESKVVITDSRWLIFSAGSGTFIRSGESRVSPQLSGGATGVVQMPEVWFSTSAALQRGKRLPSYASTQRTAAACG